MELAKVFNPTEFEDEIYKKWEASGFFSPRPVSKRDKNKGRSKSRGNEKDKDKGKYKPFCIIMPPPNANGSLHVGHGVGITLEDIMIRYHRMRGEPTLWLPGADHAGFETQVVFEKKLEKEGKTRWQFPREELYKMMWDFTQKNKILMEKQLRRLGASCDWSREIFTLDPKIVKIVEQTFKKLYDNGLIYRGERIINWCVKHQTTLSDLEVKHEDKDGALTYIKYKILPACLSADRHGRHDKQGKNKEPKSGNQEYIIVATTRPETMLGDTAIAVNPKDKRYKHLIGKTAIVPLVDREILIIADDAVEKDFGTGAVKVTPSHDPVDFEIGQRHNLEKIEVIGKNGKMTDAALEKYRGLKVEEARALVVEDLRTQGLIEKEEPHKHAVGVCYKCGRVIEPLILPQWFVKMKPLAKKVIQAVKKGEVKFVTKRFEKILFHWLKNIRDWNISRQIVWGIRIPVWYCQNQECPPIVTDEKAPKKCPLCGSDKLKQETDVFDTWFSSGQWPFAALKTIGGFERFYPTSVMETGWDILPFWVMRMLALGIYMTGKVPFKYVYLHGLVRDKERQKMSKSKGNVIDPLGVIDIYGADALRMALVFGVSAGNDITVSEDKIRSHRNFANKIWNASRFVLMNLGEDFMSVDLEKNKKGLTKEDKMILKKLNEAAKKITKYIDKFEFHLAAEKIYQFFWHEFCDKYLEEVKPRLQPVDRAEEQADSVIQTKDSAIAKSVLYTTLLASIKLLHPFMPYVTEAVYQKLPRKEKEFLMIEEWPKKIKI